MIVDVNPHDTCVDVSPLDIVDVSTDGVVDVSPHGAVDVITAPPLVGDPYSVFSWNPDYATMWYDR
jgi:hypothetical protein